MDEDEVISGTEDTDVTDTTDTQPEVPEVNEVDGKAVVKYKLYKGTWDKETTVLCGALSIEEAADILGRNEDPQSIYDTGKMVEVLAEKVPPVLQEVSVDSNGVYTPEDTYDGFSKVTVDVTPQITKLYAFYNADTGACAYSAVSATPAVEETVIVVGALGSVKLFAVDAVSDNTVIVNDITYVRDESKDEVK